MAAQNGPDLVEITTLLETVQGREPATTSRERFDRDHEVLQSVQAELTEALELSVDAGEDAGRSTASASEHELQQLLDRVVNAIEANREKREQAAPEA
jgi:acyl-CoA reductase-like NAD-dependent aldehyde dehydrogenase